MNLFFFFFFLVNKKKKRKVSTAASATSHKADQYTAPRHKTPLNVTKQMLSSHQQVNKMCATEGNRWSAAH